MMIGPSCEEGIAMTTASFKSPRLSIERLRRTMYFKVSGKRFRITGEEERVIALLRQLEINEPTRGRLGWLLPFRPLLREIQYINPRALLSYLLETTDDWRHRRYLIWLRGRCGGYIGTSIVGKFANDADASIRKETARSLKRLSGWVYMRQMASSDPIARIRMLAQSSRKSHAARQARFLEKIDILKTSARPTPLLISPDVDVTQAKPTRQPWFIRQVLMRIHTLVTGA
jgi:hypothetical protein